MCRICLFFIFIKNKIKVTLAVYLPVLEISSTTSSFLFFSVYTCANIFCYVHLQSGIVDRLLKAVKRRGPSGSFLPWAARLPPARDSNPSVQETKKPSIQLNWPLSSRVCWSNDGQQDERDSCGGVRGSVRRLLRLFRQEKTEWPQLQEQAAGTWVLTSSYPPSSSSSHFPGMRDRFWSVCFGPFRQGCFCRDSVAPVGTSHGCLLGEVFMSYYFWKSVCFLPCKWRWFYAIFQVLHASPSLGESDS